MWVLPLPESCPMSASVEITNLSPGQLNILLLQVMREIDETEEDLRRYVVEAVESENAYRMAKATTYIKTEGTVDARRMAVDLATQDQRLAAHLADGLKAATFERLRDLRAKLSAVQSMSLNSRVQEELTRAPQPKWTRGQ